ncbi:nitronate monooxygenase [Micromonosporaceae bacterium Da 78-11]
MLHEVIRPIVVAPMAGGPSTPALVEAAARAGAVGFLAAGYKTPGAVEDEVRELQRSRLPYGLNIFVPMPGPGDVAALEDYRQRLAPEAERYGVQLPPLRLTDDDHFDAKVEIAVGAGVPLVSFTFGVPPAAVVRALRAAGCRVLITVTGPDEARRAMTVGPDALIAQAGSAGGHAATTSPDGYTGTSTAAEVLQAVRAVVGVPAIAAGGTSSAEDVAALLDAGAVAVQAGTAFLLADEAGTRGAQQAAMRAGTYQQTVVTRAFTGQPARALRNRFTDEHSAAAPVGYPAVHHLTAPIRAAAAARGDPGALNLWAGTGHCSARSAPAAVIVAGLGPD